MFQLEDAAFTAASAVKAKKNLEIELEELQQQLEEMSKGKQDVSILSHPRSSQQFHFNVILLHCFSVKNK